MGRQLTPADHLSHALVTPQVTYDLSDSVSRPHQLARALPGCPRFLGCRPEGFCGLLRCLAPAFCLNPDLSASPTPLPAFAGLSGLCSRLAWAFTGTPLAAAWAAFCALPAHRNTLVRTDQILEDTLGG